MKDMKNPNYSMKVYECESLQAIIIRCLKVLSIGLNDAQSPCLDPNIMLQISIPTNKQSQTYELECNARQHLTHI